jgi:hypothetical protein
VPRYLILSLNKNYLKLFFDKNMKKEREKMFLNFEKLRKQNVKQKKKQNSK